MQGYEGGPWCRRGYPRGSRVQVTGGRVGEKTKSVFHGILAREQGISQMYNNAVRCVYTREVAPHPPSPIHTLETPSLCIAPLD